MAAVVRTWVVCSVPLLEDGNEVILYYGTGRGARGSSPAMVYLMKDSLIVQSACSQRNPAKRAEIHIDDA